MNNNAKEAEDTRNWIELLDIRDKRIADLELKARELEGALQKVEWVESEYDGQTYEFCPWCSGQRGPGEVDRDHHDENCLRQAVLANQAASPKESKP